MDMVQMLDGYGCNGNGRLTNRTGTGWVRNRFLRVGFKARIILVGLQPFKALQAYVIGMA
jgi:hypothetical protein